MKKSRLTDKQARRIRSNRYNSSKSELTPSSADHNFGIVIARYGKQALVEADSGRRMLCHFRAHLEPPVAGDRVNWIPTGQSGVISSLCERSSTLERPDGQGRLRPVAANIDLMLIVFAPQPKPYPNLLDRYLIAAEHAGIEAALVLNKSDLLPDNLLRSLLESYKRIDYRTLITSQGDPDTSQLTKLIGKSTFVLVGQSGVGKSALAQRLLPDQSIRVGRISETAEKGKHTTTTAQLYHMSNGAQLIDSPGIQEFGLQHISHDEIASGFKEFRQFIGHCQFRDCQHHTEPNCALLEALETGKISDDRFSSYKKIISQLPKSMPI